MTTFDAHLNFAITSVTTAPVPATSGTSLVVSDATVFPAVPFNATVWPLLASPTSANAEIVRVTNIASNTLTIVRAQEGSTAKTILATYQIAATITVRTITDIETAINALPTIPPINNDLCDGRLTLTTLTPVTTSDVTAATNIFFTPYKGKYIGLYDGVSAWAQRAFTELTLAVPATTSTMYDVFVYDNAGVAAIESLAWTNDTTRATALVLQDGVLVKSGATTRRYVGSFRTTTVSGQTEDSVTKRYVWNYYNRASKHVRISEATASWTYSIATWRQANASAANQIAIVNGFAENAISLVLLAQSSNTTGADRGVSIGENSTTTVIAGTLGGYITGGTNFQVHVCTLSKTPPIGLVTYVWLESSQAAGVTTFNGTPASAAAGAASNGLQGVWWC